MTSPLADCARAWPTVRECGWESISPRARVLLSYGLLEGEIAPTRASWGAHKVHHLRGLRTADAPEDNRRKHHRVREKGALRERAVAGRIFENRGETSASSETPYGECKGVAETLAKAQKAEIGFFMGCTSTYGGTR